MIRMLLRLICAFEPRRNFIPAGVSRGPIFSIDQMFEDANVKLADRRNRHIRVGDGQPQGGSAAAGVRRGVAALVFGAKEIAKLRQTKMV